MATRATWRTLPNDPSNALGWLVRDARFWGLSFLRRLLFFVPVVAIYALVVGQVLAFVFLMAAFGALGLMAPRGKRSPEVASPSPGPAYVGRVEIRREGAFLGDDEVSVTFVDGWMVVEGRRTSFSLSVEDAVGTVRNDPRWLLLADGSEVRFHLVPLGLRQGKPVSDLVSFSTEIRRWREGRIAYGDSVLPPEEAHPAAGVRVGTEVAVAALGTFAGLLVTVAAGFWWGILTFMVVPGPPFFEALAGLSRLRKIRKG